jgi:hypothetical protein
MPPLDHIEFAVEHIELGISPQDCVDIRINGRSLRRNLPDERPEGYAGLHPRYVFLPSRRFLDDPAADGHDREWDDEIRRTHIFRCICGDDLCSYVLARIRVDESEVVWSHFWGSHSRDRLPLRAFRFDREQYEQALATPPSAERD